MFKKLFSRRPPASPPSEKTASTDALTQTWVERRRVPRPVPTAQMIEGDGSEHDWALWLEASQAPAASDSRHPAPPQQPKHPTGK